MSTLWYSLKNGWNKKMNRTNQRTDMEILWNVVLRANISLYCRWHTHIYSTDWECACIHNVKHLINQLFAWQMTDISSDRHTHLHTHTLDTERRGDSLISSALPETDNCTHVQCLPISVPKLSVIMKASMLTKQWPADAPLIYNRTLHETTKRRGWWEIRRIALKFFLLAHDHFLDY